MSAGCLTLCNRFLLLHAVAFLLIYSRRQHFIISLPERYPILHCIPHFPSTHPSADILVSVSTINCFRGPSHQWDFVLKANSCALTGTTAPSLWLCLWLVCVCMCVSVHVCLHMYVPEDNLGCHYSEAIHLSFVCLVLFWLRQGLFLAWNLQSELSCQATVSQGSAWFCFCSGRMVSILYCLALFLFNMHLQFTHWTIHRPWDTQIFITEVILLPSWGQSSFYGDWNRDLGSLRTLCSSLRREE